MDIVQKEVINKSQEEEEKYEDEDKY